MSNFQQDPRNPNKQPGGDDKRPGGNNPGKTPGGRQWEEKERRDQEKK